VDELATFQLGKGICLRPVLEATNTGKTVLLYGLIQQTNDQPVNEEIMNARRVTLLLLFVLVGCQGPKDDPSAQANRHEGGRTAHTVSSAEEFALLSTEASSGSTFEIQDKSGRWIPIHMAQTSNVKALAALACVKLSVLRGVSSRENPRLFLVGTLIMDADRSEGTVQVEGWILRCPFDEYRQSADEPWEVTKISRNELLRSDFCGESGAYTDEEKALFENTTIHKGAGGAVYWVEHPPLKK
jgi:hypothetical protein